MCVADETKHALASKILAKVEDELRGAKNRVAVLEAQREAALILMHGEEPAIAPDKRNGSSIIHAGFELTPHLRVRAKNAKDHVFGYLQSIFPKSATVPKIHKALASSGAPVGKVTYMYHVMSQLETMGLVEKDESTGEFRVAPQHENTHDVQEAAHQ